MHTFIFRTVENNWLNLAVWVPEAFYIRSGSVDESLTQFTRQAAYARSQFLPPWRFDIVV